MVKSTGVKEKQIQKPENVDKGGTKQMIVFTSLKFQQNKQEALSQQPVLVEEIDPETIISKQEKESEEIESDRKTQNSAQSKNTTQKSESLV